MAQYLQAVEFELEGDPQGRRWISPSLSVVAQFKSTSSDPTINTLTVGVSGTIREEYTTATLDNDGDDDDDSDNGDGNEDAEDDDGDDDDNNDSDQHMGRGRFGRDPQWVRHRNSLHKWRCRRR